MEVLNESPHKIYIKSNTATVMRFLVFLSAVLLVLVVGLCIFVVLGHDDTNDYHWDEAGKFYYTLDDGVVTIVKYADNEATTCEIPANVNYGGKNYPVTTVAKNAFTNHRTLTKVTIPDSVTKIMGDAENKKGAFAGCTALTQVDLGQGIARIEAYAFKNCVALTAIKLPSSVQFVQNGAFQGCVALEAIELDSNGILGADCFADCLNVTTLQLADDVRLTDNTRQVLADLTGLTDFVITETNPAYHVQGGCLLTATDNTVVLGGRGAKVPDGVTAIMDWAWGSRAADNLYVPSTVVTVGANSFENKSICTDAATKPSGWLTTVPVYTEAQLVTFKAEGNITATAYIYRDANGTLVRPKYEDLFADVESATPFIDWKELSDNTVVGYEAKYDDFADADSMIALKAVLTDAETYLKDPDVRIKFTIDFWESFKTLYYRADKIKDSTHAFADEVSTLAQALQDAVKQIKTNDAKILESTDWWVGLQNLVDAINQLGVLDLVDGNDKELVQQIDEMAKTAEILVSIHDKFSEEETGKLVWRDLRDRFERLVANVGEGSLLDAEITACKKLNREDYTRESWEKLQDCLAAAQQVTAHNLSISVVREALADARANLREVTLANDLVRLNTWVSVCRDLDGKDYQADGYNRLWIDATIVADADDLVTVAKVSSALTNLQNKYHNLVATDHSVLFNTGSGILNKKSLPYFIVAVVLFTGAVLAGAVAAALKHQLRQIQE